MPSYSKSSWIDAPVETVFGFHEEPEALELLTPPWTPLEVMERSGGICQGDRVVLMAPFGPLRKRWVAEHTEYERNRLFADVQREGPFRHWHHRHEFAPENGGTRLTDRVEFGLPGGPLVDFLGSWVARLQLEKVFNYRHKTTKRICEARSRAGKK